MCMWLSSLLPDAACRAVFAAMIDTTGEMHAQLNLIAYPWARAAPSGLLSSTSLDSFGLTVKLRGMAELADLTPTQSTGPEPGLERALDGHHGGRALGRNSPHRRR